MRIGPEGGEEWGGGWSGLRLVLAVLAVVPAIVQAVHEAAVGRSATSWAWTRVGSSSGAGGALARGDRHEHADEHEDEAADADDEQV